MDNYKICALAILALFASFYSLFCIGHFGGDGYGDYLTAESIVLDRNLSLHDRPNDADELNYIQNIGVRGRDGKIYNSRSSLGLPLILSAFYLIGHIVSAFFKGIPHDFITMFFVSFANPVILALSCFLVFVISKHLGFSMRTSAVLSFIYGMTTMIPVYARTGFAEPALILFILASVYFILKYKEFTVAGYIALSAAALACAAFVKPSALIFIPCFVFYILWIILEKKKSRDVFIFALALALPLALIGIYNKYIYGNFFKFGGQEALSTGKRIIESAHFLKGLYYYLFSTGKGLFLFNVPIILSFIGLWKVPKERKKEAILFMSIFVINLLFFVKSFRRGSLFSWGPRYLMPSIPLLIFLIGDFCESHKGFMGRISLILLSAIGFFIMLPCMFINQSKFYFFIKEKLGLQEYMVNFIPDLSPILGAWKMFISRIIFGISGQDMFFVYNPDYLLAPKITASVLEYNKFDFWFSKILQFKPEYSGAVYGASLFLAFMCIASLIVIGKNLKE